MAVDKLVDSTQLNTDLTSVSNAIRAKTGGSSQLAFPNGFVSAIDAIPTGGTLITKTITENGTYSAEDDDADGYSEVTVNVPSGGYSLIDFAEGLSGSIVFDEDCLSPTSWAFAYKSGITSISSHHQFKIVDSVFYQCKNLHTVTMTSLSGKGQSFFQNCSSLSVADLTIDSFPTTMFRNDTSLSALILRKSNRIVTLNNRMTFQDSSLWSNKQGATIYIPKVLYDHLGDGTSLDYKASTNWAAIDGYGTITWAQIEGSQYENYYADGTPTS